MREKLADLIADCAYSTNSILCDGCGSVATSDVAKQLADSLNASGVIIPVLCKNCRFSAQHDPYDPMECVKWATKWGVTYTTPDGYCHKGERKDNGC